MKIPHFLKIPVPCVLASCVGLFLSTAGAGATVIYADDFSGPAGTDLNDTAPDIRSGTDGGNSAARWIAFNAFDADGTVGNEVQSSCALLPFIPGAGEIYTLSLDVNTTGGGVDWLALGFTQHINTGQAFVGSINGYDWMLLRQDRGLNAGGTFLGPSSDGAASYTAPPGVVNLKVMLDTTGADWSAEWFVDDLLVRGPVSYGTQPVIDWVGFGEFSSASGTVDNFSLSAVAVPEPGTGALLALAVLWRLAAFRRVCGRDRC